MTTYEVTYRSTVEKPYFVGSFTEIETAIKVIKDTSIPILWGVLYDTKLVRIGELDPKTMRIPFYCMDGDKEYHMADFEFVEVQE